MVDLLTENWAGILAKVEKYLDRRAGSGVEEVTIALEMGDELEPEEEEALLEGEEE
ncbi:hypothetical protein B0H19DRAFT_1374706 [Mycena capillaripes]|nr:hypothetical protein B0H19DRAFT_1374706 [Mycena capillaripes]